MRIFTQFYILPNANPGVLQQGRLAANPNSQPYRVPDPAPWI